METIEPRRERVTPILKQFPWREWAEYASVAGSAVGTVAAAFSGQLLYAAAPLTVALSLNLANRSRFDRQTRQQAQAAIADVRQVVETLHGSFQQQERHPNAVDIEAIKTALAQLQHVTDRLNRTALTEEDWGVLNVRLSLMNEAIARLEDTIDRDNEGDDTLPESIEDEWHREVASISADFTKMQTEIRAIVAHNQPLFQRIKNLEQQNKEIVKPYLKRLSQSLKKLEKSESLASLKAKLNRLNQDASIPLSDEAIASVRNELDGLRTQLNELERRLDSGATPSDPARDTPEASRSYRTLEAEIEKLSKEVTLLNSQMQRRFNTLQDVDLTRLNRGLELNSTTISTLQDLYDSLLASVLNLRDRLEHLPPATKVKHLQLELGQVSDTVTQLQTQIGELPSESHPSLQQQIEELRAAIASLKGTDFKYVTKQDIVPLVIAVKKLGQHRTYLD
jgi:cell division protein FtsB